MSLFTPACTTEKDKEVVQKWRKGLEREAKFKRIPLALVPMYSNEKVNNWLQEQEQLSSEEFHKLCQIFSPTNWDSINNHRSKVACMLCACVDSHSFESALFLLERPEFMKRFLSAHLKDFSNAMEQENILESLVRKRIFDSKVSEKSEGPDIEKLFFKFLRDRPLLYVPPCEVVDLLEDLKNVSSLYMDARVCTS